MPKDNKTHRITFRMNDEEYEIFQQKFQMSGAKSQGEFIRKMLMTGIVLHFDESKKKKAFRSLSTIANNINQIAMRVNSTNHIYDEDIREIKTRMEELWQQQKYFLSQLRRLKP